MTPPATTGTAHQPLARVTALWLVPGVQSEDAPGRPNAAACAGVCAAMASPNASRAATSRCFICPFPCLLCLQLSMETISPFARPRPFADLSRRGRGKGKAGAKARQEGRRRTRLGKLFTRRGFYRPTRARRPRAGAADYINDAFGRIVLESRKKSRVSGSRGRKSARDETGILR